MSSSTCFHFQQANYSVQNNALLYAHQKRAIRHIHSKLRRVPLGFATHHTLLVEVAVGCGKSAIIYSLVYSLAVSKVLVVVPGLQLRAQLGQKWIFTLLLLKIIPDETDLPIVCVTTNIAELADMSADCTTHVVIINTEAFRGSAFQQELRQQSQSSGGIAVDAFQLLIVDEAHHKPSSTYRAFMSFFACHKVLLTATPERRDCLLIHYTSQAFRYSIEQGIHDRIIKTPVLLRYSDAMDDKAALPVHPGAEPAPCKRLPGQAAAPREPHSDGHSVREDYPGV